MKKFLLHSSNLSSLKSDWHLSLEKHDIASIIFRNNLSCLGQRFVKCKMKMKLENNGSGISTYILYLGIWSKFWFSWVSINQDRGRQNMGQKRLMCDFSYENKWFVFINRSLSTILFLKKYADYTIAVTVIAVTSIGLNPAALLRHFVVPCHTQHRRNIKIASCKNISWNVTHTTFMNKTNYFYF